MDRKKILIIEDEPEIREGIRLLLSSEEYEFLAAGDGPEGLRQLAEDLDLVILDIMMPGMNGLAVCREIRKRSTVPILFLTAKALEEDKLLGLQAGADDYLTKPFSYLELSARVRSLLRRYCVYRGRETAGTAPAAECIELGGFRVSAARNEVLLNGREINLTDTEYRILLLLMKRPNRSQSTKALYEEIWNEPFFYGAGSTVMVHVRNLRAKVEPDPKNPVYIITVWGKGYQFRNPADT